MSITPHDARTTFVAGAIVQTTFTLILTMLAVADRRMRGMKWLAGSSLLALLGMAQGAAHMKAGLGQWDSLAELVFLGSTLAAFLGLHWFAERTIMRFRWWLPAVLCAGCLVVLATGSNPRECVLVLRAMALAVLVTTSAMLWRPQVQALRIVSRLASTVFAVLAVSSLLSSYLEVAGMATAAVLGHEVTLGLVTLLQFVYVGLYVKESARRLHDETRMDPLTGLRNRRAIEEAAARAVRDAVTLRRPLALVMLDLDRFKALNDTWGHALGDRALQTVGTALLQLAGHGCVARLGGEEFAVLLPGASVEEAGRLAEQIRVAVEGLRLSQGAEIASFTTSVGVSSLHPGETEWTALLHRADVALYRAKREGRNRVVLCEEKPSGAAVASGAPETMWRRFIAGRGPLL